MLKPIDANDQGGMIEAGLAIVLVALVIVAVMVYMRSHRSVKSTAIAPAPAPQTATAVKTKDPALDSAATDASSSVNDLNSSFTTDTSNSSLNATQGALQ